MKKRFIAVLFALLMMLSACSSSKTGKTEENKSPKTDATGGTVIVRAVGDPMSWNPDSLPDDNGYPYFQNIFNRLVKMDASKNIIPDLAKSWDISDDAKTISFHLVDNAKWHDGEPVTAEDVKYTFDYIMQHDTYLLHSKLKSVEEITAPDNYTVVFKLKEPNVALVSDLGWYACFIVPKHIYDNGKPWEENDASKTNPIGSGPFKLGEYKQGQSVTLVANDQYWGGRPKVDKIIYTVIPDDSTAVQSLVNGDIDVLFNVPAANANELLADKNLRLILNQYPSPMRIIFNMKNEKVSDPNVRKAIAMAINKEEISKKVFQGIQEPEYSMYPELIEWVANTKDTSPKYNPEEASKILENAGYKKDSEGYYIRGLEIEVFEGGGYPDAAKLMVASLKNAGIEMKINVSEFNAWADKVGTNRNFMLELQGGFMGPDPSALYSRYGTGSGDNWGSYSNPKFDALCMDGLKESNKEKRAEIYKEAQKILSEDLPFIPVVKFAAYDANSVKLKNLPIDGKDKWGWEEWTFVERID